MNTDPTSDEPLGFNSLDTEIFVIDGPGDNTIRRRPVHLAKIVEAERKRIEFWEQWRADRESRNRREPSE